MKINRIPFGKISALKSTACGLAAALTASLSSDAYAVDIVWSANANGGNGLTWDTTNQNWTTALATPWAGYGNFAVLGGAEVTISTPVRVDGFSGSGSIGGGTLRLGGSGVTSTFSGTLGSSTGLVWDNAAFLDFSGTNDSTGQWVMRAGGTLRLSSANAFKGTSLAKIECGATGEGFTMELAAADLSLNYSNFFLNNFGTSNYVRLAALNADRTVTYTGGTVGGPSVSLVWNQPGAGALIGAVLGLGNANSTHTLIWASGLDLNGGTGSQPTRTIDSVNGSAGIGGAISGVISDSGTTKAIFNKSGAGTLVLSAVNSYSGPTTISGGILQLGNGITDGSISASSAITNNAALVYQLVGSQTYGGVIGGTGTLTKTGTGTLTLSGANTYTGATTVSAGTLALSTVAALGATSGVQLANGTTLSYTGGDATLDRAISVSAGTGTLRNTGGGTLTLSGALTKNGSVLAFGQGVFNVTGAIGGASANSDLVVDGATVTLNNANTYNGPTYLLNGGSLTANVAGALPAATRSDLFLDQTGTGGSVLTLGAPQVAASLTGTSTSRVNLGALNLTVGAAMGSSTFAGVISGTGGLIKDGASTQVFSGTNTYAGATILAQGTLAFGTLQNLAAATNTLVFGDVAGSTNVASLDLSSASATFGGATTVQTNSALANTIVIGSGQTLRLNGALTVGYNPSVHSRTQLNVTGAGTLSIGAAGAPTNADIRIGDSGTQAITNAGTLDLSGLTNFYANLGAASFFVGSTVLFNGTNNGDASSVLLAENSTLLATAIRLDSQDGFPSVVQRIRMGGGTTVFNANTINIGGTSTGRSSGSLDFQGPSGALTIRNLAGTGRATMNVANSTYNTGAAVTGTVNLTGHSADLLLATLVIGGKGASSAGSGTGTFSFDTGVMDATSVTVGSRSGSSLTTGTAQGTMNLMSAGGTGSVTIGSLVMGVNSSSSATTSGGVVATLNVGGGTVGITTLSMANNSIGGGATAQTQAPVNSTFNVTGGATTVGTLTMNLNSSANTGTNNQSVSSLNVSAGALTIGAGGLNMANASVAAATATSSISITGGTLTLGGDLIRSKGLGTENTSLTLNGGTLDLGGFRIGSAAAFIGSGSGALSFQTGTLRNVGEINGGAGLAKTTAGTLLLSGTNAYTGATTVSAGTLQLGSASALPAATTVTVSGTGVLDLNGFNSSVTNLGAGASTATITDNSAGTGTSTLTLTGFSEDNNNPGIPTNTRITDGPTRTVAVRFSNATNAPVLNGANTFSGGLTLLNGTGSGTRLVIWGIGNVGTAGNIVSSPFGRGAITMGLAATDRVGFYLLGSNQTLLNDIIFNTSLGNNQPSAIRVDGGTSGAMTFAGTLTGNLADVSMAPGTVGGSLVFTGRVTGPNGLWMKTGNFSKTLTLTLNNATANPNDYQGNTTVDAFSVLTLGASNQIPNGAGFGNVSLGGTLSLGGFNETINGLSGAGTVDGTSGAPTLTVGDNNATSTFSGVIQNTAGSLALVKTGSGTLTLSGSNTYSGGTTLSAGTLHLNSSAALGTGPLTISGGTTLDNTSGAAVTLSTNNTQTWNGDFTFTGTNNLNLGTGAVSMGATARQVTVANAGATLTVGGTLSGTGGLTKAGAGTLALGTIAAANWTGPTTVNGGTLPLGNPGGDGYKSTAWTINSGGTVRYTNHNSVTNSALFTVNTGGTLDVAGLVDTIGGLSGNGFAKIGILTLTTSSDFSGVISGTGGSIITANNPSVSVVLSGLNTYTGKTTINGGTISINSIGNVSGGASALGAPTTVANGTVALAGTLLYSGTGNTSDRVLDLTGSGVLEQAGTGLLKFTSALTATGAGAKTLTLQGSTGGSGELAGAVVDGSGFTALTKTGSGAWTLSGANTYTGATRVDLGQLSLSGGSLGATAVTVGSGLTPTATAGHATLAVFGNSTLGTSAAGSLTISGGNTGGTPLGQGTLSLQDGTLNTLTLANATVGATNLILGGSAGNAALLRLDVDASGVDRIAVGQRLTLNAGGAVVNLNALAGPALGLGTYDILTYAAGSTITGALTFAGGLTTVAWGGGRSLTLQTTATAAQLVVATVNAPANAYWTGSQSASWTALDGSNQTNWVDAPAGVNTQQLPGLTTNVFFTANSAGNLNTTLGQDFAVNSLNFTAGAAATTISGNTLTLFGTDSNGNTAGNGISVAAGSGAHTIASDVVVGADQTWTNASGNALTVSGSIGGGVGLGINGAIVFSGTTANTLSGTITVGSGTLTLSKTAGVDAVAGGLVVNGGTVNWAAANQVKDTSAVTVNGGTLALGGFDETVGSVSLVSGAITGSGVLTGTGYAVQSGTVSARLAGAGAALTKTGAGTVALSGVNTYTGGTTVTAGTLELGVAQALTGAVTVNGGTLAIGSHDQTVGAVSLVNGAITGSGVLTGTGYAVQSGTVSARLGGAGAALTKTGAGTVTLSGQNTYTGGTTVTAGTLELGVAQALTGAVTVNGGTLAIGSFDQTVDAVSLVNGAITGSGVLTGTGYAVQSGTVSARLAGAGVALTKTGAGTVTLSGVNTYTGGTTVTAGTLELGVAQALTGAVTVNGGTLAIGSHDQTVGAVSLVNGAITGSGFLTGTSYAVQSGNVSARLGGAGAALTKTGAGTVTLSGVNTYTGGTTVTAGTLELGVAQALTGAVTVNGGTLAIGSHDQTVGAVSLVDGAITGSGFLTGTGYTVQSGTVSARLGGAGAALTKTGAGTVTLSGQNTYTGGTTVTAGTLTLGVAQALTEAVTVNGGTLVLGSFDQTVGAVSLVDGAITGSGFLTGTGYTVQSGTVSARLGGAGVALTKTGAGTVTLTGLNTYTGGTTVTAGTLELGVAQALTGAVTVNGGTLALGSFDQTVGAVSLVDGAITGSGVLTGTGYAVQSGTVSARLAGAGAALTKTGAGTVTLTGLNTYTGGTTVTAGTLTLGVAQALTGAVTLNGGTLALGSFDQTVGAVSLVNGAITGSGFLTGSGYAVQSGSVSARLSGAGVAFTKTGPGTVTLNTAAVYTGATEIRDGTLLLNGAGLGATAVTLGSGAGTAGTLRVVGDVTLGTATVGSLTILGGTGGGVLSLEDGGIHTLTLANSALSGATLTAGGVAGQDARATLELSNTTTDRIIVAGRMALNAGGLTLGVSQLSGTSLENGTYDLVRFAAGPGADAPVRFAGGLSTIPAGGGRSFTLQTTSEAVQLLVRNVPNPGALFWSGAQDGNWITVSLNNETNWVDGLTGTDTQQIPGSTSNVYFTALGAANSGVTVLGADLAINSLNFNATASGPVGISGNTLTLLATNANGNVAGSGLTVEAGSGAHTISSAVVIGGDQGWWNYSANALTVSGVIQGTQALGLHGNFTWSGSAANTLGGPVTLHTGTLTLAKDAGVNAIAGELMVNGGTVQWLASEQIADTARVTVAGGTLALGSHHETVAELIVRSGAITGTGAFSANAYTVESGTISAALGNAAASFLKTGSGTAVLSGANTFAGGARLEGGTVHVEVSNTGSVSGAFGPSIQSISVHPVQSDTALLLNGAYTLANPIAVSAAGGAGVTLGGAHTTGAGVFTGDITLGRDVVLASAGGDVEFRGALSGAGGATVRASTGRVLLAGSTANIHTGLTTLESGTLVLAKTGGASAVSGNLTVNGGRLEFAGNDQIVDTATVRVNAGTVDVGGFTDTVKDIVITGGTVTGGALRISTGVDARAGVLDVGIAGSVPLAKTTGGVTELRGASPNTFSGLTSVAAGTLLLNKDAGVTAITGDGVADALVPDVVIRGGALRNAANGQIDPTVTVLMTSGELDLNGKTETIFDFTNRGGVFRTGAGGNLTVTSLNTTTWSGGSNTVNTGGSLTTPHLVIRGGTNVVETGGVLNVGNGAAAAGGALEFSNGGSLVLQSGGATPGRLVLSDDVTVSGLGGSLVSSGTGTQPGRVDLGGTRLITVSDTAEFLVGASLSNGALRKVGTGTLILSGANTYAGGTVIDAGTVALGHARGFGVGDVRLNNATLRMNGEVLQARIGGNYIQGAGGTLQLRVSRGNGGALMSDNLLVAGRAELGGTLQITSPGRVQLRLGERVTLVEAGAGVSGSFSEIRNGLSTNTIVQPTVTQGPQAVVLEGELGSFSRYAAGSGLTLNQRATASALDRVALDPRETRLIGALSELPLQTLPSAMDRIAPEELSAVYQQAVASARTQSWNLQQRLREARGGWRGFSASGLRTLDGRSDAKMVLGGVVLGGAVLGGAGGANLSARLSDLMLSQGKEIADAGKPWTFFINGELEWVDVDSTANARGYDLQSTGVSVGADVRINEHLVAGLTTGYSRGDAELAGGGRMNREGGSQFGAYTSYFRDGFHVDGIIGGGVNDYEIRRAGFGGNARGDTEGREFHMELSVGKDWRAGGLTFGPEAALRYTWAGLEGYTERGSLAPLRIESQDAHSLQFELGGHVAYAWKVGSLVVMPEVRMFWQHETLEDSPWVASRFASGAGGVFRVRGPRLGRDSLVGSGSVTVQMGDKWSGYAAYTGEFLRTNTASHRVNLGLRMEF